MDAAREYIIELRRRHRRNKNITYTVLAAALSTGLFVTTYAFDKKYGNPAQTTAIIEKQNERRKDTDRHGLEHILGEKTTIRNQSMSRDGRRAVEVWGESGHMGIYRITDGYAKRVETNGKATNPALSPSGNRIAYRTENGLTVRTEKYNIDITDQEILAGPEWKDEKTVQVTTKKSMIDYSIKDGDIDRKEYSSKKNNNR